MVRQNSRIYVVCLKRCNKDCDKHVSRFQGNGRKSRENYFGKGQIIRNHSTKRHQNWLYSTFLSALVNNKISTSTQIGTILRLFFPVGCIVHFSFTISHAINPFAFLFPILTVTSSSHLFIHF